MQKSYDYRLKAWNYVKSAEYKKAFQTIEKALKIWPNDFLVKSSYASILGDYGEHCSPKVRKKCKKRACDIYRELMKQLRGKGNEVISSVLNEYYYHSAQRKKQYIHGVKTAAKGLKARGYYSQGVGAAWHAAELAQKQSAYWADFWARRAVRSWEKYFELIPDYYNAYVHYALALGILRRTGDMEKALRKAGKLSGKPQSYKEFSEVRGIINSLKSEA